ncbi:MAG: beta-ketoacyl synthase N-terminal-like domain-containing protein, partial [Rhodospirillales bacterium]|nr:beta-ketoacyl synthase N-terminal-like domain-containing protein [Rhodospirillales bacterium]
LNGRRDPDPEAVEAIAALRALGVRVQEELADVTDPQAVDAMLQRMDGNLPPLAGVIHSVGGLSDAALTNQNWESFQQVLWPKMLGAWHLHRATRHRDLDLFVLFSSIVGTMGNAGQANHAAANAFLDQLAGHRRALGLPGLAVAWGAWSELGEAEEQRERIARQLEAAGTGWITPQQGLRALETLIRQDVAAGMVAAMDWPTFAANHDESVRFLEQLLVVPGRDADEDKESPADLLSQLRVSQAAEAEGILATFLQKELQAVMRLPTLPAPSVGFFDLGMDSLMAVELRNRLNRAFAGEHVVSNTAVFDYPDVTKLAHHLAGELGQLGGGSTVAAPASIAPQRSPASGRATDDVAIVGMACRFPGAKDLAEYWRLLESGMDAVTKGRPDGDPSSPASNGEAGGKDEAHLRGAFVEGIQWFDSRFFRIAPIEARMMDPRQRMMLETTWQALEDAGIDPEGLRGSLTGVYGGVGGSEYRDLIEASGQADSYLGTTASVTVGRIAFVLGLEGPAMPIDMACASSLAAVHQAVAALQRGEVELALAGGVHAALSVSVSRFMMEFGMLSRSGQCRPFDAAADGYVRGEGCGMLVLKRLSEAEADGNRIWGVIKGSAVNQNGASAGLTVPTGPAQERVMEAALARAGFAAADVDYLEAHAVGSQMGDAIEVRAVGSVYGKGRDRDRPLLMGTVKSNIGHLESAAGIAALIKTVLAMQQRVIPKHLHFENPNPEIDWQGLPVRVAADKTDWPLHADRAARAAVSAFGISGTNAHVVLEGYDGSVAEAGPALGLASFAGAARGVTVADVPSDKEVPGERTVRLLPLSGKSDGALRDLAQRYLAWLAEPASGASHNGIEASFLADMAWTAAVGRSHFPHRAGVVFRDLQTLRDALTPLAEPKDAPDTPEPQSAARVAFLYGGDECRWVGMGAGVYDTEPVMRAVLDRCDAVVLAERGASLLDVMFGHDESNDDLSDPAWAQPVLYALACALTALWSSIGIRPNAVLGDGIGELAAAQAAGVLTLEGGLRVALSRGTLMAVPPAMDPDRSLNGLQAALTDLSFRPPSVPLVSSVTGMAAEPGSPLDGAYWRRQARETAALGARISALAELGADVVVEI